MIIALFALAVGKLRTRLAGYSNEDSGKPFWASLTYLFYPNFLLLSWMASRHEVGYIFYTVISRVLPTISISKSQMNLVTKGGF